VLSGRAWPSLARSRDARVSGIHLFSSSCTRQQERCPVGPAHRLYVTSRTVTNAPNSRRVSHRPDPGYPDPAV